MLVVRAADDMIRWMDVTDYLERYGPGTKHIVFARKPFTALTLLKLRDRLLGPPPVLG